MIETELDVLRDVSQRLASAGIDFMLTGSVAMNYYAQIWDLILSKLHWAKDSRSELQLSDVRNLFGSECDTAYLRSRAERLGLDEFLKEVLSRDE